MKATLSSSLRLNTSLSFLALCLFFLLSLAFAALEASSLYIGIRFDKIAAMEGSFWGGALGLCLCSTGVWYFRRRRRLMLEFGQWQESPPDEQQERRALISGARDAFMDSDFEKSGRLLQRYLEQRPGDNVARMNLACGLVMQGKIDEAIPLLTLAGDPRRQVSLLKPARAWERILAYNRSYTSGQILRSQKIWSLAVVLCVLALPQAFLIYANWNNLTEGSQSALMPFLSDDLRKVVAADMMAKYNVNGLLDQDFKRAESTNIVFYYHDEALFQRALDIAEDALQFDLAFFNLPSNHFEAHKIRIYLCDSQKEYLKRSPFAATWEAGAAIPSQNVFYIYIRDRKLDPFFLETVAHELCHICYFQINSGIAQDSWLNEGLARYQGFSYLCKEYQIPCSVFVKENIFKDIARKPLSFELFLHHRPQELSSVADVTQFYNQGHSMVYVLIQYYGKDSFLKFLHNFSMTQDMNASFAGAYDSIHNLDDLHGIWTLFYR
jgi:hypothetical protein